MTTSLYINDDGELLTAEKAAELGYVQTATHSVGFLIKPVGTGYAELITAFRVLSSAIDGKCRPHTFKSAKAAAKYIRAEGWAGDGGVSDDGVTRFDGIEVKQGAHFYPDHTGAVHRHVMALARQA